MKITANETLGVGLIGLGYWGENYLRILLQSREIKLKYICDSETNKLRRYAGLTSTASVNFTTDVKEIARDKEVEAVIIATPATSHYEIVKTMLQAGKHVLVEKPLTMSYKHALELCNLSRTKDKILMVGHIYCFNPAIAYIKEIMKTGRLGDLHYGIGLRLGLGPIRSDASCTWDLASHDIAALDYLFNQMPIYVSAHALSFLQSEKGIYDYAVIQLKYSGGFQFTLIVSWYAAEKTRNWYLVGSKSMLKFDDTKKDSPLTIYERTALKISGFSHAENFPIFVPKEGNVTIPYIKQEEPLSLEVRHFINCIREEKRPLSDCKQGLRVVRVLEAIDKSVMNRGKVVMLSRSSD